jgi:hypothetical protein
MWLGRWDHSRVPVTLQDLDSQGRGLKTGCLGADIGGPDMATLLAQVRSALVQAPLPLVQVKAAVPQVGDRN